MNIRDNVNHFGNQNQINPPTLPPSGGATNMTEVKLEAVPQVAGDASNDITKRDANSAKNDVTVANEDVTITRPSGPSLFSSIHHDCV
ncbi:unnamed protein product [Clavelina lepadiformis]|uniref:Uncharacterized protein n=1 Tax=Clavelina lepadiformis TaxID=159417 RepID=A0ABP0GIX0_CLALP